MFYAIDYTTNRCTGCGALRVTGDWPGCPHGKGAGTLLTDEYPGGLWIENLGPHPVKVYSESERLRLAKARGLQPMVRHVPVPGTDKSPHTTDWSKAIDPQTLANARALVARQGEARATTTDAAAWFDRTFVNRFETVLSPAEASALRARHG
jgi:hypothetical protein